MEKEALGTVISVKKQWWLKINTKSVRLHPLDGAIFPYVIAVKYSVDGKEYLKRKWYGAGLPVPPVGATVTVLYRTDKPTRAKIG